MSGRNPLVQIYPSVFRASFFRRNPRKFCPVIFPRLVLRMAGYLGVCNISGVLLHQTGLAIWQKKGGVLWLTLLFMYLQIIDIHKHYDTNSDKNKQWQPYELSCSHHPYIYKRTALYYSTAGDKPSAISFRGYHWSCWKRSWVYQPRQSLHEVKEFTSSALIDSKDGVEPRAAKGWWGQPQLLVVVWATLGLLWCKLTRENQM
jgi:hypothetical protein